MKLETTTARLITINAVSTQMIVSAMVGCGALKANRAQGLLESIADSVEDLGMEEEGEVYASALRKLAEKLGEALNGLGPKD